MYNIRLMNKILIFPGAFNPPHNGHVSALISAIKETHYDEIWIVPSGKRDDKEIATTYEDRRNLSALFVEYLKHTVNVPVVLLTNELDDSKGRETEEVLREIRSREDVHFIQLIGIDGYLKLKDYLDDTEKFIVIARAGYEIPADFKIREGDMFLDEAVEDISSTKIRELVRHKDGKFKSLVPEKIAQYIEDHNLYQ